MKNVVITAIVVVALVIAGCEPHPEACVGDCGRIGCKRYNKRKQAKQLDAIQKTVSKPTFIDLVQTSLKGVVHLQVPGGQGSGFVVGPRHIMTARHCTTGVVDFLITLNNECQIRATRARKHELYDFSHIWIDDLACVNKDVDHRIKHGGEHDVVLIPLLLGPIKDCVLGQSVYVIGSPFGKMNFNSLTTGIISGVNRDWGDDYGWEVAFTVDSAGHPGNSGCPVFTTDGIVRGILVGGFSPVLISVMPCDLFARDLELIRLMFLMDRYEREVDGQSWEDDLYEVFEAWPGFD